MEAAEVIAMLLGTLGTAAGAIAHLTVAAHKREIELLKQELTSRTDLAEQRSDSANEKLAVDIGYIKDTMLTVSKKLTVTDEGLAADKLQFVGDWGELLRRVSVIEETLVRVCNKCDFFK